MTGPGSIQTPGDTPSQRGQRLGSPIGITRRKFLAQGSCKSLCTKRQAVKRVTSGLLPNGQLKAKGVQRLTGKVINADLKAKPDSPAKGPLDGLRLYLNPLEFALLIATSAVCRIPVTKIR